MRRSYDNRQKAKGSILSTMFYALASLFMSLDNVLIWEDGSIGCTIRFTDKAEIKEATFHSVYLKKIKKKNRKPFGWLSIYVWAISAIAGMFVGAFIGANLILNGYSPNLTAIGVIGLCVLVVSFAISISNINEKDW